MSNYFNENSLPINKTWGVRTPPGERFIAEAPEERALVLTSRVQGFAVEVLEKLEKEGVTPPEVFAEIKDHFASLEAALGNSYPIYCPKLEDVITQIKDSAFHLGLQPVSWKINYYAMIPGKYQARMPEAEYMVDKFSWPNKAGSDNTFNTLLTSQGLAYVRKEVLPELKRAVLQSLKTPGPASQRLIQVPETENPKCITGVTLLEDPILGENSERGEIAKKFRTIGERLNEIACAARLVKEHGCHSSPEWRHRSSAKRSHFDPSILTLKHLR